MYQVLPPSTYGAPLIALMFCGSRSSVIHSGGTVISNGSLSATVLPVPPSEAAYRARPLILYLPSPVTGSVNVYSGDDCCAESLPTSIGSWPPSIAIWSSLSVFLTGTGLSDWIETLSTSVSLVLVTWATTV